jgi:hypothetical protein
VFGSRALLHSFGRLFIAIDDVIAAGNGIVSTTDHGATWQASAGIPSTGTAFDFLEHAGNLYAAVYLGTRGVYVSTDGGASFAISGAWAPGIVLQCLHAHDGVLLAGSSDAYYRSTDDGATWLQHMGLGWVRDFASLDGAVYAARYPGGVSRSTDAGLTWTALSAGMPGTPHLNALAVFDGSVYAAVNNAPVMRWDGDTWIASGLAGEFVNALVAVDGALVAGTSFSKVFLTTDGASWTDFSDGFTGGIVESMNVTPTDVILGTRNRGIWSRSRDELPAATAVLPAAARASGLHLTVMPNPFVAQATVRFELPRSGHDRRVRRLRPPAPPPPGGQPRRRSALRDLGRARRRRPDRRRRRLLPADRGDRGGRAGFQGPAPSVAPGRPPRHIASKPLDL